MPWFFKLSGMQGAGRKHTSAEPLTSCSVGMTDSYVEPLNLPQMIELKNRVLSWDWGLNKGWLVEVPSR